MRVRVMVWNVHGFRAGTRTMADAVRAEEPDILLLNETGYLGFRLGRFARRAGMEGASGATLRWRIPNAVLARQPWRPVRGEVAVLPRRRRALRRGIVMGLVRHGGVRLWTAAVHLGLSAQQRAEHALVILDLLDGRHPVILGGDLNEDPFGRAAARLADELQDAGAGGEPTFPASEPRARIDYIFVAPGIRVERVWHGNERLWPLSDHLPVLAELDLTAARRSAHQ
jgi:endonuclease/exonuclease/phosphatase family metal-dependent hydrolase